MGINVQVMFRDIKYIEDMKSGSELIIYEEMATKTMKKIVRQAEKKGLIESTSVGMGWNANGDFVILENTYRRC